MAEWVAIGVLLFLAIGGLVGGVSMITHPDGSGLGMTTELLKRSPVATYLWPGVFLLLVMSVWPVVNIVAILSDQTWAASSVAALGVVAMLWILYQYCIIRTFSLFQPTIFVLGALLAVLGVAL